MLVMRVLRVHLRAGMTGQLLPEFLRDACIRHCRDETMPGDCESSGWIVNVRRRWLRRHFRLR